MPTPGAPEPLTVPDVASMITRAAQEVFETMLGSSLTISNSRFGAPALPPPQGVLSFIGVTGRVVGTGTLVCSGAAACELAQMLVGSTHTSVDEDVLDAYAELTNMIVGNIKNELEERSGPMALSIPMVIYGRNFAARTLGGDPVVAVQFAFGPEGKHHLDVQVCLIPRPAAAAEDTAPEEDRQIAVAESAPEPVESRKSGTSAFAPLSRVIEPAR